MTTPAKPHPIRKPLCHRPPLGIDTSSAFYFVTLCAADRTNAPLIPHAAAILESARYRHNAGLWFLSLFLIMPDHIHMLVHIPTVRPAEAVGVCRGRGEPPGCPLDALTDECGPRSLAQTIGDFKSFISKTCGIAFQKNFFDTRIRDATHYAEKWNYILRNPVARGLVATPRDWPHVIAFNRETGEELPHK